MGIVVLDIHIGERIIVTDQTKIYFLIKNQCGFWGKEGSIYVTFKPAIEFTDILYELRRSN